MPSSNGVYSLPSGYLAVTGATIQASQHNPPLEDIAAALTARLSRDGTAAMTGALQLVAGAVGLPGVVFSTDLTSGFYKTTSGIGVAIAGVKVAEFLAGGLVGSRVVGELVPFTRTDAPSALWVLPYGQTLSRTTYAALWAFAQIEIAAGNTFYNNGDGSTTFGIGDLRGRILAGKGNMGGSDAARLTASYFGADGTKIGSTGGLESNTLVTAQMPVHAHGVTDPGHGHSVSGGNGVLWAGGSGSSSAGGSAFAMNAASISSNTTGISIQNAGSGAAHANVQPTMVTNYILFVGT